MKAAASNPSSHTTQCHVNCGGCLPLFNLPSHPVTKKTLNRAGEGRHLASGDVYRKTIQQLQKRNPNLEYPDWKVPNIRIAANGTHVVPVVPSRAKLLRFDVNGYPIHNAEDLDLAELRNHLMVRKASTVAGNMANNIGASTTASGNNSGIYSGASNRHLYLLEGLNPDFVEAIGAHFSIDPSFFSRHQRTALWEGRHKGGNTQKLASAENPAQSFMMEYCEILYFTDLNSASMRNPNDNRHIDMSAKPEELSSDLDRVGNMHRKASFWSKTHQGTDGWDAVLVLDPPLPKDKNNPEKSTILVGNSERAKEMPLGVTLYQNGYLDFIDSSSLTDAQKLEGPPRTSIMDDLCFYYRLHNDRSACQPKTTPLPATVFLQKIVASNYMILTGYLESCLNELEVAMRLEHVGKGTKNMTLTISAQWSILQSWSHRFPEYCGMLDDILAHHSRLPTSMPASEKEGWDECTKDFQAISAKMAALRQRTGLLAESFVGLASMAGMQESLDEAKNVQILTFLGIFFLPLSWIASIFAIAERPDPEGFPLYCKTAFPTAFALTLIAGVYIYLRRSGLPSS